MASYPSFHPLTEPLFILVSASVRRLGLLSTWFVKGPKYFSGLGHRLLIMVSWLWLPGSGVKQWDHNWTSASSDIQVSCWLCDIIIICKRTWLWFLYRFLLRLELLFPYRTLLSSTTFCDIHSALLSCIHFCRRLCKSIAKTRDDGLADGGTRVNGRDGENNQESKIQTQTISSNFIPTFRKLISASTLFSR